MRHRNYHVHWIIAVMAIAVATSLKPLFPAAHAQGFNVQPMMMEAAPRSGQTVEMPLRLNNTSPTGEQTIELRLVELTQTPGGSWYIIDPESGEEPPHDASLVDWVSLPETTLTVPPAGQVQTTVTIDVPRSARGAYFGALIAETPRPADAQGLVVRVRFLIPIIVQTQGMTVRQQVQLQDANMTFVVDEQGSHNPTTMANLVITNEGQTYSRMQGQLSIDREANGRWRPVTRTEFQERSIIPGVTLTLEDDLERRLPSGTYRLRGALRVDGRVADVVEKVIEFEGDPTIDTLAYDTALVLDPEMVRMEFAPGATRTTILSIENPGEDAVSVEVAASTPDDLRGIAMGNLRGDAFSAEPWTEIQPSEFTLRPNGRRNVRVVSRVPREGVDQPNYYADLILRGRYEDGQSAGETRSLAHLMHSSAENSPAGTIDRLLLSEGETPSEQIVQARFVNHGDVHLEPAGEVQVMSGRGTVARSRLVAEPGPILPLGRRSFGAVLDFSEIEPGYYALRATLGYGFQSSTEKQTLIEVSEEMDGRGNAIRSVQVLDDEASVELPDGATLPGSDDPNAEVTQEATQ